MTHVAPNPPVELERVASPGEPVPVQPADAPLPLEYAGARTPRPPLWRRVLRGLYDLGPVFPKPSLLTLALFLACFPATYWLAHRPQAWRIVSSTPVGQANGPFPNIHYLPQRNAVVSANGVRGLRVWRPWADELLLNTEPPPAALPPNPLPGRQAQSWWVTASDDESKLLAKSDLGTYLWDARTGRLLADLSTYLAPEGAKRHDFSLGALSPDGSRLCVVNDKDELLLYDVTGAASRLLARRQLTRPPNIFNFVTPSPRYHIRFSPDGRRVLATSDTLLRLGDADTLEPQQSWEVPYSTSGDVVFLRDGRRMLTLIHGRGGAQEVRLYDLESGAVLRSWKATDDPFELAVSPDERCAVLGVMGQAAMILNLADDAPDAFAGRAPSAEWMYSRPQFFPDGRRVVMCGLSRGDPGVIDLATGRHVATLDLTPDPGGRYVTILPGGKRLFVVTGTQLHVIEHVGRESALGMFATVPFWALALCVGLLVASLCRDALRSRRRRGRAPIGRSRAILAGALAAAGGAALICPFVWFALGSRVWFSSYTWWEDDGWLVWLFVLYGLGALGLLAGSRVWTVLLALALAASVKLGPWLASTSGDFALHPERVFDRMWMIPRVGS